MATERKKHKSGKFCVAGGPGLVSCKNTTYTEGISMHLIPERCDNKVTMGAICAETLA